MTIKTGDIFRETVNSELGYEDWEFLGGEAVAFGDGIIYPMRSDRGVYWFTEEEISEMRKL